MTAGRGDHIILVFFFFSLCLLGICLEFRGGSVINAELMSESVNKFFISVKVMRVRK